MQTIQEFILENALLENGDVVSMVTLGVCAWISFDFLHLLFSAVLSWFKRY